jgi:hypothetical protein
MSSMNLGFAVTLLLTLPELRPKKHLGFGSRLEPRVEEEAT